MVEVVRTTCLHCRTPIRGVAGTTLKCPMCKTSNHLVSAPPPVAPAAPTATVRIEAKAPVSKRL